MRVYLSGQKSFGAAVLRDLIAAGVDVVGVTAPRDDGDSLRREAIRSDVRIVTDTLTVEILPPGIDLIVCAHAHAFVSAKARAAARLGAIGYHPSLLPLHRGRDAVAWTVRMGDRVAGGSVYWLNDQVDGGPIAAQEHVLVRRGDTAADLWRRDLFPLGVALLDRVVRQLRQGVMIAVPQDEALATWEPSIGRPPLHRPDVPRLGAVPGVRVVATHLEAVAVIEDLDGYGRDVTICR